MRLRCAIVAVLLCVVPVSLSAHVTLRPQQSRAGAEERYTVRVPTEGQVATASVELEIPSDVTVTDIPASASYRFEAIRKGDRITRVVWIKTIPPKQAGEFVFLARNPKGGAEIRWRAHQRFVDGSVTDWIGPPGDKRPAAVVKLTP